MSNWYSAAQLAEMKLPGLPGSERGMIDRARKENWTSRQVPGKGGKNGLRTEYQPPKAVLMLISEQRVTQEIAVIDAAVEAKFPAVQTSAVCEVAQFGDVPLDEDQRICDRSREKIVNFVKGYNGSVEKAIGFLNEEYAAGRLNSVMRLAYEKSWDKPRNKLKLVRKTYCNWLDNKAKRGSYAPLKIQKDMSIKPWHALAITLIQRPQGSIKQWIYDQLVEQLGEQAPTSYDVMCAFFREKMSAIDQIKGRYTGSKLRSYKNYTTRTSEGMYPWQEIHADGWNTHCTAPHPRTGEFVTHEVWIFRDVATRFRCPPGLGLTENFDVITSGLKNCIRVGGVPVIVQTDSTKIIKGSERFQFIADHAGFTVVHPVEVGNSQANGIAENGNKDLDRACRDLATYQAKGMDSLTLKRVKKITADMVKAADAGDVELRDKKKKEAEKVGKGIVFVSYQEFVDWINGVVDKLNDRPHPALPKIRDDATGKLRHQTPREAMQAHLDSGWEPHMLAEHHMIDLFHTRVQVKVTRGGVIPYGKMRYTDPLLLHWNGREVVVAYDKMEWKKVWIYELDGSEICEAEFSHATPYRAQTAYENGEEKRANAQ
ncbi:MAG: Mu transposase C-terminal domain-containing protein [Sulfurimicrobium sp.]|nr:Mu transposase C-terminal domain-containing protein [Sulfurimicrobium sp.]